METKLFSTAPRAKDPFWQIVFLPTVTMLRNREFNESYTVLSAEWLFWPLTILKHDS